MNSTNKKNYMSLIGKISLLLCVPIAIWGFFFTKSHSNNRSNLERYYVRELEEVYTKGYAVDQKEKLGWRQSEFEAVVQKVEEQMLKEGFNREEIRKMKDEGRKKRPRNKAILGSVFLSRKTMI
jgi:hypothetical protein